MKIVILEGEDTTKSRERYFTIISGVKKRGWETKLINKDIKNSLQNTNSLFSKNILYILEKPNKLSINEYKWLQKNHTKFDSQLLIYQQNNLPQTIKKFLPKESKIEKFELPKYIFKFLDSFYPKNSQTCIKLLQETLNSNPPEFVMALLTRQLKDLYIAKTNSQKLPYPSWRISKLKSQASNFSPDQIKKIISDLALADIKSKTGKGNLTVSLNLVITKYLC